jgi:hypothetical protein
MLEFNVYDDNIHNMIDWRHVKGFDWDRGNARKSADKHEVSQSESEQVFFNRPIVVLADEMHSRIEERYHALGRTDDDRKLHITFTLRLDGTLIRVISARDMHRKERKFYEQA